MIRPMERTRRLTRFWSWLPAFRVVAETEHLPTAASALRVSAPALSRTIRLIEDDLGVNLFDRVGRRIVLSDKGREFLGAVRDAMRRVDDGLGALEADTLRGPLRLSARSTHAWLMLPAMSRIVAQHPGLVPSLVTMSDDAITDALRSGSLDVALADRPASDDDILVERLGEVAYAVFAGVRHELAGREEVTVAELLRYGFVAPPVGVSDNWPPELDRCVAARVDLFHNGVTLVEQGSWLGFFPEPIVQQPWHAARLVRVHVAVAASLPLYVVFRRPVGTHRRTEVALAALRSLAADVTDAPSRATAPLSG